MKKIILVLSATLLFSCNQNPSLQNYFVENTESADFISVDVSPSILNSKSEAFTLDQKDALKSFKKMNVLAFKLNEQNQEKFAPEQEKVKTLLKDKKYQQLMKFGNGKDGAAVYFVGKDDAIEEFVIYGSQKENGFAVVRILGDNMNPEEFMTLFSALQQSDMMSQLKPLEGLLK